MNILTQRHGKIPENKRQRAGRSALDVVSTFGSHFTSDCECGESNNLSEMGAEFGLVCCCFLLPSHPRWTRVYL
jgi:hypothetical protein